MSWRRARGAASATAVAPVPGLRRALRRTVAVSLLVVALSAIPGLTPASAQAQGYSCQVSLWAADELNTSPGFGARYYISCNFYILGYQVDHNRIGVPRDSDGYPAIHDPSFFCDTGSGTYAAGSPTREFACQLYDRSTRTIKAGGYWNATVGPVCDDPAMVWQMKITAVDYTPVYGTFPIDCGDTGVGGDNGGDTGGGEAGNDLSMSRTEVRRYIRGMIGDETKRRPRRLRRRCRRLSGSSFRCRLRFRIRKRGRTFGYRGTARFWHFAEGDTVYWTYVFKGRRRNLTCARRHPGTRRCLRRVKW